MDAASLSALCVSASDVYLDFLKKSGKGVSEIGVHGLRALDVGNCVWELRLRSRLYNLDSIRIQHRISGVVLGPNDFSILEYDADTGVLIVKFTQPPTVLQNGAQSCHVFVISSLLFLVENVGLWFAHNGSNLRLPEERNHGGGPVGDVSRLDEPLPEQAEAINTALNEPLSYVWGPPGTGKTRLVLTHAALALALGGSHVGVFAPTNIALEQAMEGLLDGAARLGMKEELFLRLGAPSRRFADAHPDVCEIQGLERRIKDAERQIKILKEVINHRRGSNALHSGESMLLILGQMGNLFAHRQAILQQMCALRKRAETLDAELSRFTSKVIQFFARNPLPAKSERDRITEQELIEDNRLATIDGQINTLAMDFHRTTTDSPRLTAIQDQFNPRVWQNARIGILSILAQTQQWLIVNEALVLPYREKSLQELQADMSKWEAELQRLKQSSAPERMKECLVVGMTLDLLIGRFRQTPPSFDHLFLDEAGYASLIKALALFRHGSPVTMLGDHKQLPPIVETDDNKLNVKQYRPVRLWGASAIHVETAFRQSWTTDEWIDTLGRTAHGQEPDFQHTLRAQLKTSRRFGANLCSVLDRLFYGFGFVSANAEKLDIYVIDAPRTAAERRKREAPEEGDAICSLIENGGLTDVAIITPYRPQVALLGQRLRNMQQDDRILTIHGSQGREWDTVVVSVVDGSLWQPWFTDTHNRSSRGDQVMNTAVSRARQRLIIVCEANYWRNRADRDVQLISKLLDVAEPWNH